MFYWTAPLLQKCPDTTNQVRLKADRYVLRGGPKEKRAPPPPTSPRPSTLQKQISSRSVLCSLVKSRSHPGAVALELYVDITLLWTQLYQFPEVSLAGCTLKTSLWAQRGKEINGCTKPDRKQLNIWTEAELRKTSRTLALKNRVIPSMLMSK